MKASRWLPLMYGLLLLWAGVHYAARIDQVLDVGFADETYYLDQGLHLTFENVRTFRAPLYGVWYKALSLIEDDPLALYDVNLRVQVVLLPIALFWALWASGVPPWAAFLLGWAWLLGDANLEPWPRVSAFAWILILGGLGGFMRLKRDWRGWVVLLGSVGLSMYARPEMMLAFGLLLVWGFWQVPRTERRALLIGLGILSVLMGLAFGSPYEPGRLFEAFGQHFAFRWKARYLPNGLPWNHWEEALQTAFGPEVHSLSDVVRANPRLVVEHVAANAKDALWRLGKTLFSHTPYLFKKWSFVEGVLWLGVGLLGLGWWWWRGRRQADCQRYMDLGVVVGILALPSAISTVFIYPRYHYLLGLAVLGWYLWGVVVLGALSREIEQTFPRFFWAWKGGLAISVLLTLTTPSVVSHFGFRPILDTREALVTLRVLERYGVKDVAVPGDQWGGRNVVVYLPDVHFVLIDPWGVEDPARLNVQAVVLDNGAVWLRDAAHQARLLQWKQQGWEVLCTSRRPYVILTRVRPQEPLPVQPCDVESPSSFRPASLAFLEFVAR